MRPIWKGAICFGTVTIPVKLYTATEQKDVRFRLLHREDGAPIEEKRFCSADGKEVAWDDLVRGYEVKMQPRAVGERSRRPGSGLRWPRRRATTSSARRTKRSAA